MAGRQDTCCQLQGFLHKINHNFNTTTQFSQMLEPRLAVKSQRSCFKILPHQKQRDRICNQCTNSHQHQIMLIDTSQAMHKRLLVETVAVVSSFSVGMLLWRSLRSGSADDKVEVCGWWTGQPRGVMPAVLSGGGGWLSVARVRVSYTDPLHPSLAPASSRCCRVKHL